MQQPKQRECEALSRKQPEVEEAEVYEQQPREKLHEDKSDRKRATPLPLKVDGQLVFPDDKKTHPPTTRLASVPVIPLALSSDMLCNNGSVL